MLRTWWSSVLLAAVVGLALVLGMECPPQPPLNGLLNLPSRDACDLQGALLTCGHVAKELTKAAWAHATHAPRWKSLADHEASVEVAKAALHTSQHNDGKVTLAHTTGHVWGLSMLSTASRLDLSDFNHIIAVDQDAMTVEVEGRIRLRDILEVLVPRGLVLENIPDMVHLSAGGLYVGVGGGAASFRFGAFHHTVSEVHLLTSDGRVLRCSADSNEEVFRHLPGSLGTLGYILRMKIRLRRASAFVHHTVEKYTSDREFFEAMQLRSVDSTVDFLDGTSWGLHDHTLVVGRMVDAVPKERDVASIVQPVYAEQVRAGNDLYLSLMDYIYRWDPDGYYSSVEGDEWMRDPSLRNYVPTFLMRSDVLRNIFTYLWSVDMAETMCHDYVVPQTNCSAFLHAYDEHVGLYPMYMVPVGMDTPNTPQMHTPLWAGLLPGVDFGVGYGPTGSGAASLSRRDYTYPLPRIRAKRWLDAHSKEVRAAKLAYVPTTMVEDEFWDGLVGSSTYTGAEVKATYLAQKQQVDPLDRFPGLYAKFHPASMVTLPSGCYDEWEHLFPAEKDDWEKRSCRWKKEWGQCPDVDIFCRKTCGLCSE